MRGDAFCMTSGEDAASGSPLGESGGGGCLLGVGISLVGLTSGDARTTVSGDAATTRLISGDAASGETRFTSGEVGGGGATGDSDTRLTSTSAGAGGDDAAAAGAPSGRNARWRP